MNSKKHSTISKRIKKWASGKAEQDYEIFFLPAKEKLELYLSQDESTTRDINNIVAIHSSLRFYSSWHFDKFLDSLLNGNSAPEWDLLVEAMNFRILQFTFGYSKPNHIAPFNDGQIGLAICDSIILHNVYGEKIIRGYSESEKRPNLNPQSVIQFSHKLYSLSALEKIDKDLIFRKPLVDQYSELLKAIKSDDEEFQIKFNAACEFHMERSKNSMDYEFSYESDMVIPSELLATLKLRKDFGYEISFIDHPLAKPFVDFVSSLQDLKASEFFNTISRKIEADYL